MGLGLEAAQIPELIRLGEITSICETGINEDEGRRRLTFFFRNTRLSLVIDAEGQPRTEAIHFGDETSATKPSTAEAVAASAIVACASAVCKTEQRQILRSFHRVWPQSHPWWVPTPGPAKCAPNFKQVTRSSGAGPLQMRRTTLLPPRGYSRGVAGRSSPSILRDAHGRQDFRSNALIADPDERSAKIVISQHPPDLICNAIPTWMYGVVR